MARKKKRKKIYIYIYDKDNLINEPSPPTPAAPSHTDCAVHTAQKCSTHCTASTAVAAANQLSRRRGNIIL